MKSPPAAPSAGAYSAVSRKLMASMGWSEGKGLGKHEQGADKHIEHKKRGDNVGLGADATVEAQFAAASTRARPRPRSATRAGSTPSPARSTP